MSFYVRTAALRACRDALQSFSGDVDRARAYADPYVHVERLHSGIFQNVVNVNDDVRTALDGLFTRLKEVTLVSSVELDGAATWYDETDAEIAGNLDAVYEEVVLAPGDSYAGNAKAPEDTVPGEPDDYEPPSGIADLGPTSGSGGGGGGGGSW